MNFELLLVSCELKILKSRKVENRKSKVGNRKFEEAILAFNC